MDGAYNDLKDEEREDFPVPSGECPDTDEENPYGHALVNGVVLECSVIS